VWSYAFLSSTTIDNNSAATTISATDQAECFIRRIGLMVTQGHIDLVLFYVVC
jgi:hypothetical protein